MDRTGFGAAPRIPRDVLEVLRGIQHQLGNVISAVTSHVAILQRRASSGAAAPEMIAGLSRAGEQAVSVAACLRHLLICQEPKLVRTDAATIVAQTRDLVCALSTRPVAIEVRPLSLPSWRCEADDSFVLLALVLFAYREPLRDADRVCVSAELSQVPAPAERPGAISGEVAITLIASRTRAVPAEQAASGALATAPAIDDVLRQKMDELAARVTWEQHGPGESVLQISLPARQEAR